MKPLVAKRAYSRKELCRMYRVTYKTFAKWIDPLKDEINTEGNRLFNIREVNCIFNLLGSPLKKQKVPVNRSLTG